MLTVFSDGSCVRGNPGDAAGAYVLVRDGGVVSAAGRPLGRSTNNRGELSGAIFGLEAASAHALPGEAVLLVTDSRYVSDGVPKALDRAAPGKANNDLWGRLGSAASLLESAGHALLVRWVRGHDDTPGNELVDQLARSAAENQQPCTARGKA